MRHLSRVGVGIDRKDTLNWTKEGGVVVLANPRKSSKVVCGVTFCWNLDTSNVHIIPLGESVISHYKPF